MASAKYTSNPWSCKDFDEDDCRQEVLDSLKEHYNTIYDCAFLPDPGTGQAGGLLLAAYHSGDIRLFNWQQICNTWLTSRSQQGHVLSWQGHTGPVYAVALLQSPDFGMLVATAGDDGYIRIWKAADLISAAAAAAAEKDSRAGSSSQALPPAAAAEVRLPHVQNPLGVSDGAQPAAQVLAVDQQHAQLFIGASDGGVHVLDIAKLSAAVAAAAAGSDQGSKLAAAAAALTSLSGHAAGVLGMDYCAATRQLASGSEDGTVRVWDCSTLRCLTIINPWDEVVVPLDQPRELLRCVKSSPVACVKFDAGGNWLVVGTGQGNLTLWNCRSNSLAKHKSTNKCTPQALVLAPSTVYMAGTDKKVHQYTFLLEEVSCFDVGAASVFGISIDPASGMLAVCGSKGCIDLLSPQGANLGVVRPPSSVLVS